MKPQNVCDTARPCWFLAGAGRAGLALFWQDRGVWRSGWGGQEGLQPFEKLPANEVAQIRLYDG